VEYLKVYTAQRSPFFARHHGEWWEFSPGLGGRAGLLYLVIKVNERHPPGPCTDGQLLSNNQFIVGIFLRIDAEV
jgi:hypothetical protein